MLGAFQAASTGLALAVYKNGTAGVSPKRPFVLLEPPRTITSGLGFFLQSAGRAATGRIGIPRHSPAFCSFTAPRTRSCTSNGGFVFGTY